MARLQSSGRCALWESGSRSTTSLGLPGFFAYLTIVGEIGGGTLLVLGIETRWVALLLIPLIAGTIVLVHGKNGWLFTNKDGGWEFPAFWIVALVALALLGHGTAALQPMLHQP
jgi:putative oxidoreductase